MMKLYKVKKDIPTKKENRSQNLLSPKYRTKLAKQKGSFRKKKNKYSE